MRIYRGRIEPAAEEIVRRLIADAFIEVAPDEVVEVQKDLESVMLEYLRTEREIGEKAKDLAAKQNLGYAQLGKLKRSLAKEKSFGLEDEGLEYIVQQMIEIMFSSSHVEEVFGEDHEINRVIVPILRKHMMSVEEELDKEVRAQIKNLEDAEGTSAFEMEYSRVRGKLERLKKLT